MDPAFINNLIPIIAILATFGTPVAIVFAIKHFKYKHRELEAELEERKLISSNDRLELEKRIERLESVIMGARAPAVSAPPQALSPARDPALYEAPPSETATAPATPNVMREKA
jgi:hypothetical protein